jgi:hypothetical protein
MNFENEEKTCLNCGKDEHQIPLLIITYKGKAACICSGCLPVLIHNPQKLSGGFEDADSIPASSHHHD